MEPSQKNTESTHLSTSGCEGTAENSSNYQLRQFVVLTVRVMKDSLKVPSQKKSIAHIKYLVNQTMEGLTVPEGYCPNLKDTKQISKAKVKDLKKKFDGRPLKDFIISQYPAVDAAIVGCLQDHIKKHTNKAISSPSLWKDTIKLLGFGAAIIASLFLLLLI